MDKQRTFTEDDVVAWCAQAEDTNILHIGGGDADAPPLFEGHIVPGMMLLDAVSGLITEWGRSEDAVPVLMSVHNVAFDAPVYIGDTATIELVPEEQDGDYHTLWFGVEVDGRRACSGAVNVKLIDRP